MTSRDGRGSTRGKSTPTCTKASTEERKAVLTLLADAGDSELIHQTLRADIGAPGVTAGPVVRLAELAFWVEFTQQAARRMTAGEGTGPRVAARVERREELMQRLFDVLAEYRYELRAEIMGLGRDPDREPYKTMLKALWRRADLEALFQAFGEKE